VSKQGWRGFLAAEGVEDWVVLHGGATAVFRVGSVREAAQLAEAVAAVPGLEGSGTLLTSADARLTVRLRRDLWQLFHRLADAGTAVLVSSHVMDEAERCDRLVLMRQGQVIANGSPGEIRGEAHDIEAAFLRLVEGRAA